MLPFKEFTHAIQECGEIFDKSFVPTTETDKPFNLRSSLFQPCGSLWRPLRYRIGYNVLNKSIFEPKQEQKQGLPWFSGRNPQSQYTTLLFASFLILKRLLTGVEKSLINRLDQLQRLTIFLISVPHYISLARIWTKHWI